MNDLEFVKAYLAKHCALLEGKAANSKTSIQMRFAHEGRVDEEVMGKGRWFSDVEMGSGPIRAGFTYGTGGLRQPPVTIFVYGFIRDNLELFRKPDESTTTCSTS